MNIQIGFPHQCTSITPFYTLARIFLPFNTLKRLILFEVTGLTLNLNKMSIKAFRI